MGHEAQSLAAKFAQPQKDKGAQLSDFQNSEAAAGRTSEARIPNVSQKASMTLTWEPDGGSRRQLFFKVMKPEKAERHTSNEELTVSLAGAMYEMVASYSRKGLVVTFCTQ